MSDKTLIDDELFVISIFLFGTPLILTALIGEDYLRIIDFLKYIIQSVASILFIDKYYVFIGIVAICILSYLILKIFHLAQYLLVRKRISRLNKKELSIKQNQQNNLNTLRREMQNFFLEAKTLLNTENTEENKQKLEKIQEKLLQSKFKALTLQDERIKYIGIIGEKIQQIKNYLQSKEKEILDKKEQIKKKLNIENGYFKKANLSEEEIQVLLENKFVEASFRELNGIGNTPYLLKPRHNESAEHLFIVRQIEDYLKGKVQNVETKNSVVADLIFDINEVSFAIEVETGTTLSDKEKLITKVETNNKKFGQNWCFVVTNDRELATKYRVFHSKTYNRRQLLDVLDMWLRSCKTLVQKPPENTSTVYK